MMTVRYLILKRMAGLVFLGVLVFAFAFVHLFSGMSESVAQPSDDDWPMYQHDPTHSGRTPATIVNSGPLYVQWAYAFGERVQVEAQPVTSNGVIYQGVMNGEMHAIDADTGVALWIVSPGGPIPHTAAVYGNRVYFGSLDGNVYALSTTDGSTVWQFHTGGPVMSAPAIVNDRLYIGSNDSNLYALNVATGGELWRVETDGPVVSSPAVAGGRVYFGSEDLMARCVNAVTGALIWDTPLYGVGMHNTHPVLSDDGSSVIFLTVKAGGSSYVHNEGYPNASTSANPVETWNTYYQTYPTRRYLYYLDTTDGHDLWNPTARLYVPLPIPYWGVLHPILHPDGSVWFPAPAGTDGNAYELDHDNRLFRTDLSTGVTIQVAGGSSLPEFQLMMSETGRHTFSGNDYYYTISEDLGVYRPGSGTMRAMFSNGDASGYNFGSHMNPHSPLPSRHLWRYGGVVAMGGLTGASPPIVANDMVYFNSYGWLYAVGQTNHGYDPATSFPPRDNGRLYELTYPRSDAPTYAEIEAEVAERVADIIALGTGSPPITARWEQSWDKMQHNEFPFELYGFEADLVRVLSEAYPHLSATQQVQLKSYLSTFVANTLLDNDHYTFRTRCIHYGQTGIDVGDDCSITNGITSWWFDNNRNLIALRLYALWAYADTTGDWSAIESRWSLITQQFQLFVTAYDPSLGFCDFEEWRVKRLSIGAQIGAAQAVRDMADHLGHTSTQAQANTLLQNLLDTRIALVDFVPYLYDNDERQPAQIRLNSNGTINNDDIMQGSPYNNELIPYDAAERNRDTDPSQVNWWDGSNYRVDAGTQFMHYPALSGYFPLSSEMSTRLRADLLDETEYYVKSYEVNNPWWWMSDLAHHTTGSGEHLYHSPTLAWTMFQVKAWVLQEEWDALVRQLPEPVSFNSHYDLYRLQNLVTLLDLGEEGPLDPEGKQVYPTSTDYGDTLTYYITLNGSGQPITLTDSIPVGTAYVPDSAEVTPVIGNLVADPSGVTWTGTITEMTSCQIIFQVQVETSDPTVIENVASVQKTGSAVYPLRAVAFANSYKAYLPIILK
ncbi:MAG: PQQ-binding-like beta-propeller repeat protein [Chloroflexi bacterium]|nr:PQQ-binding-like beta-propeller repeat protein [Chloroflexota bacterium]